MVQTNIIVRGYANGILKFTEPLSLDEEDIKNILPLYAERHAAAMAAHTLHMIEIEFLDEPDPLQRFFRFGTDPGGMVAPMQVKL